MNGEGVWGSLKKKILKLDVVKKGKPGAKRGLDILEMLKKRRRVLFYVSRRQVENLNGNDWHLKKMLNRGKPKINGEIKKRQQSSGKIFHYPNPVILWNEGQDLA